MTRVVRFVGVCLLLAVLTAAGCDSFETTPGYDASKAVLDSCGRADRELSGDLAADLIGGWEQNSSGTHPLTTLAPVPQVIYFSEDGTGQIWWTSVETTLGDGDVYLFEWRVEDGHLVVDDLPPADVIQQGPSSVLVGPVDDDSPTGSAPWSRCDDRLELPELTPEYRTTKALINRCQDEGQELTGKLVDDLPGSWLQRRPGDHPFTALAISPQIIHFAADGNGAIWWADEARYEGGFTTFDWRIENNQLIVDELPPIEGRLGLKPFLNVTRVGATTPSTSTGWFRCPQTLALPADG